MWFGVSLAVSAVTLLLVIKQLRGVNDLPTRYIILAIWFRFFLSAFHETTFQPLVAGLSMNAVASIAMVGIAFLLIEKRYFMLRFLVPFYFVIGAILLSGVMNGLINGAINNIIKWLYLIVVMIFTYRAMQKFGHERILGLFVTALSLPVILQIFSILLRYGKAGEADGSISFIGGYNHEAVFSTLILTFTCFVALKRKIPFQVPLVLYGLFGLFAANYRTSLLAAVPIIAVFFMAKSLGAFNMRSRFPAAAIVFLVMASGFLGIASLLQDRFADIGTTLSQGTELFKPPNYYSEDEKDLFSARVFIWSEYINAYVNSGTITKLIGFGPDYWTQVFAKYAHNTFVSFLYEYGFVGFLCVLYVFYKNFRILTHIKETQLRVSLIGANLGFIVLNLATMPLWAIEGIILFGVISATGLYSYSENAKLRRVN